MGGMELIREVAHRRLLVTTIVTTAFGSVDRVVEAMRPGAYDFLTKPIDPTNLKLVMDRALRQRALQDEVLRLRQELKETYSFNNIISRNPRMHGIFELVRHIAGTKSTVLIEGETGTGKELIAKAVHYASEDRQGNLVTVNCAAFPRPCWRASCSATRRVRSPRPIARKEGRFELADKGTIFLDEIGDISQAMQAKLLRVLQEKRFERVGGHESLEVDVRVVAATNRNLEKEVREGRFREDLYYRLNVIKIDVPPLRGAAEDIPLLITHFLNKYARPTRAAQEGLARGDGAAAGLPVAGQRARARERHRARLGDQRGRHHRPRQAAAAGDGPGQRGQPPVRDRPEVPVALLPQAGDRADRAAVHRQGPREEPGQRRPLRRAVRPVAAERLGQDQPVSGSTSIPSSRCEWRSGCVRVGLRFPAGAEVAPEPVGALADLGDEPGAPWSGSRAGAGGGSGPRAARRARAIRAGSTCSTTPKGSVSGRPAATISVTLGGSVVRRASSRAAARRPRAVLALRPVVGGGPRTPEVGVIQAGEHGQGRGELEGGVLDEPAVPVAGKRGVGQHRVTAGIDDEHQQVGLDSLPDGLAAGGGVTLRLAPLDSTV